MHMFCIFCIPAVDNHRTLFRYHPGEAAEFYQATPRALLNGFTSHFADAYGAIPQSNSTFATSREAASPDTPNVKLMRKITPHWLSSSQCSPADDDETVHEPHLQRSSSRRRCG